MSFNIEHWLNLYTDAVKKQFGNRIWFIGLQGSYGRGEATDTSDIDVVLILDSLSYQDLSTYSQLLDTLPNRDKICGFVSGRKELEQWEKSDLFQFCHDTTEIVGSLDDILQIIDKDDVKQAVHMGACNIYHACVHNAVHEKSMDNLKAIYKSAVFVIQAIVYLQRGSFVKRQTELGDYLEPEDRRILDGWLTLKRGDEESFSVLSENIMNWSSKWLVHRF